MKLNLIVGALAMSASSSAFAMGAMPKECGFYWAPIMETVSGGTEDGWSWECRTISDPGADVGPEWPDGEDSKGPFPVEPGSPWPGHPPADHKGNGKIDPSKI